MLKVMTKNVSESFQKMWKRMFYPDQMTFSCSWVLNVCEPIINCEFVWLFVQNKWFSFCKANARIYSHFSCDSTLVMALDMTANVVTPRHVGTGPNMQWSIAQPCDRSPSSCPMRMVVQRCIPLHPATTVTSLHRTCLVCNYFCVSSKALIVIAAVHRNATFATNHSLYSYFHTRLKFPQILIPRWENSIKVKYFSYDKFFKRVDWLQDRKFLETWELLYPVTN